MGLGLLILVSVGKENLYLSAQPEITFFKIAYKRYTNYSIEPTPQYFKTTPDFGRRCTINISKNADLLGSSYLYIELPNIQQEQFNQKLIKEFSWTQKIGLVLINFVELEIGGTIVDRQYGEWMNIWHELTVPLGLNKSYDKMTGSIPELTQLSTTKKSFILYIPLSFWFCLDTGLALPLVSLMHNDIKIHVEFSDFNTCYNISPSNYISVLNNFCLLKPGEYFYQNILNSQIIVQFVSFDQINQILYYNQIKGTFIVPKIANDPTLVLKGQNSNFIININPNAVPVTNADYFKINPPSLLNSYLVVNYIYLDNFERYHFINNDHEYLVPVSKYLSEQIAYSTNINYKLPLSNPIKLLVWRACLLSNINSNNKFNYTSVPYTSNVQELITSHLLVVNSVNRMNLNSTEYYTYIQNYQNNYTTKQKGIYSYSFALNPKDLQPSGTMNFSRLDDAYLQLTMNKIINYQNPASIKCYAIEYNLFRIINGIGGLTFNL